MSINTKNINIEEISTQEMKEYIINNLECVSDFTVKLMYEFFKCTIEDEQK